MTAPADPDRGRGLYPKYQVTKLVYAESDRSVIGHVAPGPVFVLAYLKDPHARVALAAYIESCRSEYPILAADLERALENTA